MALIDIDESNVIEIENISFLSNLLKFDSNENKFYGYISFEKNKSIITKKVFIDTIFKVFSNSKELDCICSISFYKEINYIFYKKTVLKKLDGDLFHGSGYLTYFPFDKVSLENISRTKENSVLNLKNEYRHLF